MLNVVRSFFLRDRIIAFVSATQLTELSCRLNLGITLADDSDRQFVLSGVSSLRGGDRNEVVLVLRAADGRKDEPVGRLHPVG